MSDFDKDELDIIVARRAFLQAARPELAPTYILDAEDHDGPGFWLKFKSHEEALADLELYFQVVWAGVYYGPE